MAVRRLVRQSGEAMSSGFCIAEMAAVLHRHLREGRLNAKQTSELFDLFLQDVDGGVWRLLPLTSDLLRRVGLTVARLAPQVFLRAGDAIHLLSARDSGVTEIWTNDRRLLEAAEHFGLAGRRV